MSQGSSLVEKARKQSGTIVGDTTSHQEDVSQALKSPRRGPRGHIDKMAVLSRWTMALVGRTANPAHIHTSA